MKKIMIFVGVAIALCAVLVLVEVGFRKDENDVKSFEKPKNSANIETNENMIESKEEVHKIDHTEFLTEDGNFIIVYGYDKNGRIVWKYETKKAFPGENMSTELLDVDGKVVYVNDDDTIKALDYQTGKVIWECPNVSSANTSSFIDYDTKTLYLYSPVTNIFYAIDSNGKMLKEINMHDYVTDDSNLPIQSDYINMHPIHNNELDKTEAIQIMYTTSEKNEFGKYEEVPRMIIISVLDYSVHFER